MSRLRYIYSSNFKAAPVDILAKILLKENTYTRLTLSLKTNMYFIYVLVSKYTLVKVSSVLQKKPLSNHDCITSVPVPFTVFQERSEYHG